MSILALFIALLALLLFWLSGKQRRATGIPPGRIIYADTNRWGPVEKPLFAPSLNLAGKPDYLVDQDGLLIPVEVKSRRIAETPYDSHIFQLAAYCLLVQYVFGKRPPYGILHYSNRTFAIDYTPELENALLKLLDEMRSQIKHEADRSHNSAARCRHCGFNGFCDQAID